MRRPSLDNVSFATRAGNWCDVNHTLIPRGDRELCDDEFTPMSPQSPKELLEQLRASLKHFDECSGMGNSSDVMEIKLRLVRRIADVERIVQLTMHRAS